MTGRGRLKPFDRRRTCFVYCGRGMYVLVCLVSSILCGPKAPPPSHAALQLFPSQPHFAFSPKPTRPPSSPPISFDSVDSPRIVIVIWSLSGCEILLRAASTADSLEKVVSQPSGIRNSTFSILCTLRKLNPTHRDCVVDAAWDARSCGHLNA